MTIKDVIARYPDAKVSQIIEPNTGRYHNTNGTHAQRLEFDTDVSGRKLHARIYSRENSELVSMILLEETNTDVFADRYVREELRELLTIKYGPPEHAENAYQDSEVHRTTVDTWNLPSTIIKLSLEQFDILNGAVELRYLPSSMLNGL